MESLQQMITLIKSRLGIGADAGALQLGLAAFGALVVLLLVLWLVRALWRIRRPVVKPPAVPSLCGCAPPAARTVPDWITRWSLALDYLRTRREWRYASPWLLALGETGAGKSSLLASVPPQLQAELHGRQRQLAIEGVTWHGIGKGFILDPKGQWPSAAALPDSAMAESSATDAHTTVTVATTTKTTSAATNNSGNAKEWQRVLNELDALRPERALDGILLFVSAQTLQQAGREERQTLAENARRQLQMIEQRFEFALPVYVVVTASDSIKGFAAFWRSQAPWRREEMLGWSAPAQMGDGPPEVWAHAVFDHVGQQLQALQVETAAHCERIAPIDADAFFLFPRHFAALRIPFADWLALVFQATPWQTTFFCRGVYFTGVIADDGARPPVQDTPRHDVSFVNDLLLEKILAEPRLGRPTRQGLWSRNGVIRRLQWSAIAAFCVLLLGFALTTWRIDTQVGQVVGALKLMQQLQAAPAAATTTTATTTTTTANHGCIGQEPVYQLIEQIARIDADAQSWLMPLSWFDHRLSTKSAHRIADDAFKNIILPGIACQLGQRATDVSNQTVSNQTALTYPQALAALMAYVQDVQALEQNTARFQRLLGNPPFAKDPAPLTEFIALTDYAYRTALPAKLRHNSGLLPAALNSINPSHFSGGLQLPSNLKGSASRHIDEQAGQVQRLLMSELQTGGIVLTKLEQKRQPILQNIKQFTAWLDWVRKSWLGSSASNNPLLQVQTDLAAKLQPLILQFGYPATPLGHASSQFEAAKLYPGAMQTLINMQLPEYGALFITIDGQITLNPRLLTELIGLESLVLVDYMQIDPILTFSCQGKVASWNGVYLNQALQYDKSYERFLANPLLRGAPAQPLYQQLARYQLDLALNHSQQQAQAAALQSPTKTNGNSGNSGNNANTELRISQDSTNFGKLLPALQSLQKIDQELGLNDSGTRLNQCVRQFSSDNLGQIQLLSEQSQLYQPTSAPAASRTDANFFDLGSTPVIKDYLARQISRVQVLTGYAGPYLDFLNQSEPAASPPVANTASAPYWNNTVTELKNYALAKDPNAQASLLDTLFLKQFPDLSSGNCSKTLGAYQSPAFGNDLFSIHRQQLEKQVQLRCKGERYAQADAAYQALAKRFNRELSGRYPFGALEAGDADIGIVKAFFTDYAANSASLEASLAGLTDPQWNNARHFLSQLDSVGKFLQGSLLQGDVANVANTANTADSGGDNATATASAVASPGAVRLKVNFRAQGSAAVGSDQIASWSLSSAAKTISYPNRGNSLDWDYGQPLVLDMEWANRSLWRPAVGSDGGDVQIDGSTASFAASGNWALLRLIARHPPKAGIASDPADSGRVLLEFDVPLINNSGSGKALTANATLYISFKLSGSNAKAPASLKLPSVFPRLAPQ